MDKLVSIIVPIFNEERSISRTLNGIVDQSMPADRYEVLVVDGQSTDRTVEIVQLYTTKYENVRLLDNPHRWSSAARNIGIRESTGQYVLIIDGHCELRDRAHLDNLVDAFEKSGADCLGRPQSLDIGRGTQLQRVIAVARKSPLGHHPDSFIYSNEERLVPAHSVAVAYRRDVFDKVGLFDERFDACEDVELNHRIDKAGMRCFFTPRIVVHYEPRASLRGLFKQLVRYGRGRIRLLRKHPETWSLKTLVPPLFVLGLIVGALASFFHWGIALLYFSVLAIYLLLILVESWRGSRECAHWQDIFWLPVVFAWIHIASGVGQWLEVLFPGGRKPRAES